MKSLEGFYKFFILLFFFSPFKMYAQIELPPMDLSFKDQAQSYAKLMLKLHPWIEMDEGSENDDDEFDEYYQPIIQQNRYIRRFLTQKNFVNFFQNKKNEVITLTIEEPYLKNVFEFKKDGHRSYPRRNRQTFIFTIQNVKHNPLAPVLTGILLAIKKNKNENGFEIRDFDEKLEFVQNRLVKGYMTNKQWNESFNGELYGLKKNFKLQELRDLFLERASLFQNLLGDLGYFLKQQKELPTIEKPSDLITFIEQKLNLESLYSEQINQEFNQIYLPILFEKKKINEKETTTYTFEELDPSLAIFASAITNDCTSSNSAAYAYVPTERRFLVIKGDEIIAILGTTDILVEKNQTLYIHDFKGSHLSHQDRSQIFDAILNNPNIFGANQVGIPVPDLQSELGFEQEMIGENKVSITKKIERLPIDVEIRSILDADHDDEYDNLRNNNLINLVIAPPKKENSQTSRRYIFNSQFLSPTPRQITSWDFAAHYFKQNLIDVPFSPSVEFASKIEGLKELIANSNSNLTQWKAYIKEKFPEYQDILLQNLCYSVNTCKLYSQHPSILKNQHYINFAHLISIRSPEVFQLSKHYLQSKNSTFMSKFAKFLNGEDEWEWQNGRDFIEGFHYFLKHSPEFRILALKESKIFSSELIVDVFMKNESLLYELISHEWSEQIDVTKLNEEIFKTIHNFIINNPTRFSPKHRKILVKFLFPSDLDLFSKINVNDKDISQSPYDYIKLHNAVHILLNEQARERIGNSYEKILLAITIVKSYQNVPEGIDPSTWKEILKISKNEDCKQVLNFFDLK